MLVAFVAVWRAHVRTVRRYAADRSSRAANAIQSLNLYLRSQSKRVSKGCESTLLVMRHCEKLGPYTTDSEGNEHCSYIGFERAKFLATLFGSSNSGDVTERWPAPLHLFALAPDRGYRWNFREWETLYPLSKKLGIDIDIVGKNEFASEYFDLLRSGQLCGQVAVISWKHEYISDLSASLGCGPDEGCPAFYPEDSFDQVWQLKYVFHPLENADDKSPRHERENGLLNKTDHTPSAAGSGASPFSDQDQNDQQKQSSRDDDQDDLPSTPTNTNGTVEEKEVEELISSGSADGGNTHDDTETRVRRYLKGASGSHNKHKHKDKHLGAEEPLLGWSVYGTVSYQNFDPLAFSKLVGDYPEGGTKHGGRWAVAQEQQPYQQAVGTAAGGGVHDDEI